MWIVAERTAHQNLPARSFAPLKDDRQGMATHFFVGSRSSILGLLPPKGLAPSLPRLRTLTCRAGVYSRRNTAHHLCHGFAQASLREGGGFCEAKDGRSPRKVLYHLCHGFAQAPLREGGGFCEAKDGRSPRKALHHLAPLLACHP